MNSIQGMPLQQNVRAQDILLVLWRRLWVVLLILSVSLGTTYFVSKRTPRRWKAEAQLLMVQRAPTFTANQSANATPMVSSAETQVAMLQGRAMAQRTIDWLKNDALAKGGSTATDMDPDDLQKATTISVPRDTNIFSVGVEAESKEHAEQLANAVCEAFVQWKKEVAQRDVQETAGNLEKRVDLAKGQMVEAERAEMLFKQQHRLADVPAQQRAAVEQYLSRQAEVEALKQELFSQFARIDAVSKQLGETNAALKDGSGVRDDSLVISLQQQLTNLEMERANALLKYRPDYPGVFRELDGKIADVKNRLAVTIQGTLSNKRPSIQTQAALEQDYKQARTTAIYTQAKLNAATQMRDQLKQQLKALPQESMEYARLARNAELTRSLHSSLQNALNSARIDREMVAGDVQIANYAYAPELPFRPNRGRDLAFGGVIGVFLSLACVLLLEQSDKRVRKVESVRRLVSGPVVGVMPRMNRGEMRQLLAGNAPPQAEEAYSLARANLSLVVKSTTQRELWQRMVMLVTSAVPGEGKSLTSAELARSIARTGKSVVLVDADMRRPAQNTLFRSAEPHGLADVLAGRLTLEETLVDSGYPNLTLLHSGNPDRNPTELISMPGMAETLETLRKEADVVLVDAPACSVVADALLLAPHTDCILYVVGAGRVDENTMLETTTALQSADTKGMFYFVNRAPRDSGRAYKYYAYVNSKNRPLHGRRENSSTQIVRLPSDDKNGQDNTG